MKKVTVLRLSGCGHCKDLVGALEKAGVRYTSIDADEYGDFADKVELIVGTNSYPIVIVDLEDGNSHFLFRAEEYDETKGTSLINAAKTGVLSINELVEKILKLI